MKKLFIALSVLMLVLNIACKKDETKTETPIVVVEDPAKGLIKIGETYIAGNSTIAMVYANNQLFVGYNKIYVVFYDSVTNEILKDGNCKIETRMDMGTMHHGSPVENSDSIIPANGLYKTAAVFSMPSGAMGNWKLLIFYHNYKNYMEGVSELQITVNVEPTGLFKSIFTNDSTKVFVSLVQPMAPKVGTNDFEITLHKMASMFDFPAIEDYEVEIEPIMPSMGHGSPNNVNPIHIENGHYLGKINFTMTGLWRVNFKLKKNGIIVSDGNYFEITL